MKENIDQMTPVTNPQNYRGHYRGHEILYTGESPFVNYRITHDDWDGQFDVAETIEDAMELVDYYIDRDASK